MLAQSLQTHGDLRGAVRATHAGKRSGSSSWNISIDEGWGAAGTTGGLRANSGASKVYQSPTWIAKLLATSHSHIWDQLCVQTERIKVNVKTGDAISTVTRISDFTSITEVENIRTEPWFVNRTVTFVYWITKIAIAVTPLRYLQLQSRFIIAKRS